MENLKTATGKKFSCDYFNPCEPMNRLTIRVLNASIAEVAAVFSNYNETKALWCDNTYVAHYSTLVSIMPEGKAIRVTLKRE